MKKKHGARRIKRIGRPRARRGKPRRIKLRAPSRSVGRSPKRRVRRSASPKKQLRLEAADIALLLCLFALIGGIALLLYLHYAHGLNF
ncbi:MAG: hypothetical protein IKZ82_07715 [Clostridia bacterium]|nr:hypothetical protein [Clostridia bacterium]